jgi:hypothetical protein
MTAVPLFYHRGSPQLPGPVWKDNKCAFDSLVMALLNIRVNMQENPLFANTNRGIQLMHLEFPVLTDVIERFIRSEISNIEFTALALDLFRNYALTDIRWVENDYLSIDGLVEFTFQKMKMNPISLAETVSEMPVSIETTNSFSDHQIKYDCICSGCGKALRTVVEGDFQIIFSPRDDLTGDALNALTLPAIINFFIERRKAHHLKRVKGVCCEGREVKCEFRVVKIPEILIFQFNADKTVSIIIPLPLHHIDLYY